MPDYPALARTLTDALKLRQPPIAVCLHIGDTVPDGVSTVPPRAALRRPWGVQRARWSRRWRTRDGRRSASAAAAPAPISTR